jgi:hypothetical protein
MKDMNFKLTYYLNWVEEAAVRAVSDEVFRYGKQVVTPVDEGTEIKPITVEDVRDILQKRVTWLPAKSVPIVLAEIVYQSTMLQKIDDSDLTRARVMRMYRTGIKPERRGPWRYRRPE